MKPWEKFWDLDIIGIREGAEEDTTFYSILGHGGDCYGIVVYEGYAGLNDFMMITMQEKLNLPVDYVMFSQKNLTCYWGNREELTDKQRKNIKEMGYKYRGKNQWLYFLSFEPGYYPYNLDQDEVLRMTNYFRNLELALQYYESVDVIVSLAEELIGFIFQYGAPKEVRVSNILVEAGLEQICETCGIKLRRVKKLQAIEEFREGMRQFM